MEFDENKEKLNSITWKSDIFMGIYWNFYNKILLRFNKILLRFHLKIPLKCHQPMLIPDNGIKLSAITL